MTAMEALAHIWSGRVEVEKPIDLAVLSAIIQAGDWSDVSLPRAPGLALLVRVTRSSSKTVRRSLFRLKEGGLVASERTSAKASIRVILKLDEKGRVVKMTTPDRSKRPLHKGQNDHSQGETEWSKRPLALHTQRSTPPSPLRGDPPPSDPVVLTIAGDDLPASPEPEPGVQARPAPIAEPSTSQAPVSELWGPVAAIIHAEFQIHGQFRLEQAIRRWVADGAKGLPEYPAARADLFCRALEWFAERKKLSPQPEWVLDKAVEFSAPKRQKRARPGQRQSRDDGQCSRGIGSADWFMTKFGERYKGAN